MPTVNEENENGIRITEVIGKKRDGISLNDREIEYFVKGVVSGNIEASQTGRFLYYYTDRMFKRLRRFMQASPFVYNGAIMRV